MGAFTSLEYVSETQVSEHVGEAVSACVNEVLSWNSRETYNPNFDLEGWLDIGPRILKSGKKPSERDQDVHRLVLREFQRQISRDQLESGNFAEPVFNDGFAWSEDRAPRFATKLGGLPYRETDAAWPNYDRNGVQSPLQFYCQFCFLDSKDLFEGIELPGDIMLVFQSLDDGFRDVHIEWVTYPLSDDAVLMDLPPAARNIPPLPELSGRFVEIKSSLRKPAIATGVSRILINLNAPRHFRFLIISLERRLQKLGAFTQRMSISCFQKNEVHLCSYASFWDYTFCDVNPQIKKKRRPFDGVFRIGDEMIVHFFYNTSSRKTRWSVRQSL